MLSKVRSISKQKLTESPLIYLLRCQSKDFEQFNNYFDRYFSHSGGDLGEDFKTTEVVFKTFEKLNKRIITSANSLGGLKYLRIKITDTGEGLRDTHCEQETNAGKDRLRWWKSLQDG